MAQLLPVSRAARLVGVTRGALQRRIRDNELETFEGQVRVSDLLRVFPEARLEDDSALERVNRIKSAAAPRRDEERELPPAKVLASRLTSLSRELTEAKAALADYSELAVTLAQRLGALASTPGAGLRDDMVALSEWLRDQIQHRPKVPKRTAELLARDTFLRMLAAQVKILPSGHEFFVEGTDSILEAALRAGLAPRYGCTSGTCGSCKARVVSGEVLKVRDHEYDISDTEHNLGYVLMCSYTAVTDLVIEAGEAHRGEDIPRQDIPAKVRQVARPGQGLAILQIRTPTTQRLRFLAGQEVTLTLEDGASADLPLASCQCDGENLEFHVVQRGPSAFTDAVFAGRLQPGTPVRVTGPSGSFVLGEDTPNPILFLACDDGFAPIKSLVESAISSDDAEAIHLVWAASNADGHYMANRCRAWADALDDFQYSPVVLAPQADAETLATALDSAIGSLSDMERFEAYAAGPAFFVDAATALLTQRGVPSERLHLKRLG